jgi:hypothetical protein
MVSLARHLDSIIMNDPVASYNAPPPRYLLESDSEDEEGQGIYGAVERKPTIRLEPRQVTVSGQSTAQNHDVAIVAIGQAGKYLKRKLGMGQRTMSVHIGDEQVGRGTAIGPSSFWHTEEIGNADVWPVAEAMMRNVRTKSW